MNKSLLSLTVLALAAAPIAAHAAPCRDAHGRFAACTHAAVAKPAAHPVAHATPAPHVAAAPKAHATTAAAAPKRCKIGGRFASCSAPGAKPV